MKKKNYFPNVMKILGTILLVSFLLIACQSMDNPFPTLTSTSQFITTKLITTYADFPNDSSSIRGKVLDELGNPIQGATVRIKASEIETISSADGSFTLENVSQERPFFITAWQPGYYINGIADVQSGMTDLNIVLHAHHEIDNPDYAWMPSTFQDGQGENQGCAQCHSNAGTELEIMLPVDEWLLDAHSQSAYNQRFLSMYYGTDLDGNQSPLTRYAYSKDYGRVALSPDLSQTYYGPGYKLDFPDTDGNCTACHLPAAAVNAPYTSEPSGMTSTELEGIPCDFCHKISDIKLEPKTGLPYQNMPGVLSYQFLRPPEGQQFFAGPYDDVAPGHDTYSPLQQESQFCAGCHFGTFWDVMIYNSFGEWLESPYSDPETGKTCQDCHMPPSGATYFALPSEGAVERDPQTIFSHRMAGASDEFLLQNAVTLNTSARIEGDQVFVDVTILNDMSGHHVPTDSPLRQMILLVQTSDQTGKELPLLSGPVLPDWTGIGDQNSGYYAGLPGVAYAKILIELWTEISPTGAYWNPTRIISDNRIAAFGSDTSQYVFQAPDRGEIIITVRVIFRRAFIELSDQKGWDVPDLLMESEIIELNTP